MSSVSRFAQYLEAVFAGVTGSRHAAIELIHEDTLRPVIGNSVEHVIGELLQDMLSSRSLERDQRERGASVMYFCVQAGGVALDPLEVLVGGAGIDHQKEIITVDSIDQQVVEDSTRVNGHRRILNLIVFKLRSVV